MFFYLAIGQDNNRKFENANTAYNAGQFEKAVLIYKEILESGEHSAALFSNCEIARYSPARDTEMQQDLIKLFNILTR